MSETPRQEYVEGLMREREKYWALLEKGRTEFYGYGRELFERGIRRKLESINQQISRGQGR